MGEVKHTLVTDWIWEQDSLYGKESGYTVVICDADFPEENEQADYHKAIIAAAPDLLAALKEQERADRLLEDGEDVAAMLSYADAKSMRSAAIAKAEGRDQ